MPRIHPTSMHESEEAATERQTRSLMGLAVVLLLVVGSLVLVHVLRASSAAEDCLMAGRDSCDGAGAC